jgi:hypothetical protein
LNDEIYVLLGDKMNNNEIAGIMALASLRQYAEKNTDCNIWEDILWTGSEIYMKIDYNNYVACFGDLDRFVKECPVPIEFEII